MTPERKLLVPRSTTATVTSKTLAGWLRGAVLGSLLTCRVATAPSPTSRPRFARIGNFVRTYFAENYQTYVADCQRAFAVHADSYPIGGHPLVCRVDVIGERPKTTKLSSPRGDVDNYVKGALDAATKAGLWSDDGRIETLIVTKRWAKPGEEPGVLLTVGEMNVESLEEVYERPLEATKRRKPKAT